MWKSREGKEPPPQFFAEVVAYLNKAFPRATISQDLMRQLRPFLVEEWRNGQKGAGAAKATCSCDGTTIEPSPATGITLPKRSVRPPKGARRGDVFGLEEIREAPSLAGLRADLEVEKRHVEFYSGMVDELQSELARATARTAGKLQADLAKAQAQLAHHQQQVAQKQTVFEVAAKSAAWVHPKPPVPKVRLPTRKPRLPIQRSARGAPLKDASPPGRKLQKGPCTDCKKEAASPAPVDSSGADLEALVNEFAGALTEKKG